MKPFFYFNSAICAAIIIALFSCTSKSKDISIDDNLLDQSPSIHRIDSAAPSQDPIQLTYQEYVAAHPEYFGQNCLYFTSEARMEAVYDSVSQLGWASLANWANLHGISNNVIASNIVYDSIVALVESDYEISFGEAISPNLIPIVSQSLAEHLADDESGMIAIIDSCGYITYEPIELMSLNVFANSNRMFVVDSTIHFCLNSPEFTGDVEIPLDTMTFNFITYSQFHYVFTLDDLMAVLQYNPIHHYSTYSSEGDPRSYVQYFLKDNYKTRLAVSSYENYRPINKSRRITKVTLSNYLESNGTKELVKCRTSLYLSVESYNNGNYNQITHMFSNTGNINSKDYYKRTSLNDEAHSSFLRLSSLEYIISNEYGIEGYR